MMLFAGTKQYRKIKPVTNYFPPQVYSLVRGIFLKFVGQPECERASQANPVTVSVSGEF